MAEFSINVSKTKNRIEQEEGLVSELKKIRDRMESSSDIVKDFGGDFQCISQRIKKIVSELENQEKSMLQLSSQLNRIVKIYEETEKQLTSEKLSKKAWAEAKADVENILEDIEKAYENGIIKKEVYKMLVSAIHGLSAFSWAVARNALMGIIQDKTAEGIANALVGWIRENTTFFMDRGLMAALVGGGNSLMTEAPSWLASVIRGGAKYGVPIIGTAIDYALQVNSGENKKDAALKAGAHTVIGMGSAAVGAEIATMLAISSPAGVVAAGAVVGAVGAVVFDYVYDHREEITKGVKNLFGKAGNAIEDTFQGLGSVFG
ncbi:MAG: hypothetical protein ACI4C5_00730 [Lachnospiraceae bacterium]